MRVADIFTAADAPGNVDLQPVILHNSQKYIAEKIGKGLGVQAVEASIGGSVCAGRVVVCVVVPVS